MSLGFEICNLVSHISLWVDQSPKLRRYTHWCIWFLRLCFVRFRLTWVHSNKNKTAATLFTQTTFRLCFESRLKKGKQAFSVAVSTHRIISSLFRLFLVFLNQQFQCQCFETMFLVLHFLIVETVRMFVMVVTYDVWCLFVPFENQISISVGF